MKHRIRRAGARHATQSASDWYKDAIIYEVRVRSFLDSNGDGIGDFRGLAQKLDYLADLGVTALWILPFYPSPLRDDGYDISDYTDVHPECGSLEDFQKLVDEIHTRGMKVITELVLNHTSDQHPWFERARRAPAGSPERAFYVWSSNPRMYRDARIIFKDFETSNWTWDPVAKEYFWHRFYSHQPDLNFENAVVHEQLFAVVDFWLKLGVDGLRLDAVPYLYEQEGTSCENLPQTHAFLRALRSHIDARFPSRMLLAEANQWPEDAAAYFGDGDECHMNFHFPLMPRMFMAIHTEDRFPIVDILAQTPTPPKASQWALFLRNHDELTLEMVTEDERDTMYRVYAAEPAARINLGIRRRLAPLVANDRRKIELLNGLLLSLPGTPVLYYGDEIGMGDNVFLGDRDGVRTPMQWNMDRNAGFSSANPQKLILPVNIESEYHYATLNVETQENNPSSLLWWTKRIVALRRESLAFGRGTMEILHPPNPKVLAFLRRFEDEVLLVVANLSRSVQCVELDLGAYKGVRPVELFGRTDFARIGDRPYVLTLGEHGFYWLSLQGKLAALEEARMSAYDPPTLEGQSVEAALRQGSRAFEEALQAYLETRPWFPPSARPIAEAGVVDVVRLADGLTLLIVRVDYASRDAELCPLFLRAISHDDGPGGQGSPLFALARWNDSASGAVVSLVDALDDAATGRALLSAIADREVRAGRGGRLKASVSGDIDRSGLGEPKRAKGEHPCLLWLFDDRCLLRVLRLTDDGLLPELEMTRFLSQRGFAHSPAVLGSLEYDRGRGPAATIAVLERQLPHVETAFRRVLSELGRFYERVLTTHREAPALDGGASPGALVVEGLGSLAPDLLGGFRESLALLGQRTGELHRELLQGDSAAFAPEPYSTLDRRSDYQSLRNLAGEAMRSLQSLCARAGPGAEEAASLLPRWGKLLKRFDPLLADRTELVRIRCPGALDLEQVALTGNDFAFADFDRGATRSAGEARRKRLAMKDLASLVRSLYVASHVALLDSPAVREADRPNVSPWAGIWTLCASAAVVSGYRKVVVGASLVPDAPGPMAALLDVFLVESLLRELLVDLDEPTQEVSFSLRALSRVMEFP